MAYFAKMVQATSQDDLYATFRKLAKIVQSPFLGKEIQNLLSCGEVVVLGNSTAEKKTDVFHVDEGGRYRDKCGVGKKFVAIARDAKNEICVAVRQLLQLKLFTFRFL